MYCTHNKNKYIHEIAFNALCARAGISELPRKILLKMLPIHLSDPISAEVSALPWPFPIPQHFCYLFLPRVETLLSLDASDTIIGSGCSPLPAEILS